MYYSYRRTVVKCRVKQVSVYMPQYPVVLLELYRYQNQVSQYAELKLERDIYVLKQTLECLKNPVITGIPEPTLKRTDRYLYRVGVKALGPHSKNAAF